MFRISAKSVKPLKWEYVVPLLIAASLIFACIVISSKKYYWNDELYSYYFLADRSFAHMLVAFNDKINNTPILYFLLGWLWARLFGAGEISLRLFSCLGFCTACIVVWITLRRTYDFLPTAIGISSVFCTSSLILDQAAEARMYGLFFAVCALGLFQFDQLNRSIESRWNLLFNICIHAAIVNTHLFGIFYSGSIVLAQLIWDSYCKIFRTKIYTSIVLGWVSLVFYIPAFLQQADAGKPRTWIPIPTLPDLLNLIGLNSSAFFQSRVIAWIALTFSLLFLLNSYKQKNYQTENQSLQIQPINSRNPEIPLLVFSISFLLVPIFAWLVSRTVKPIFLERYLISSCLSWIILVTYATSCFTFKNINSTNTVKKVINIVLPTILVVYLLLQPIKLARSYPKQEMPGSHLSKYGYANLPIVVQFAGKFIEAFHYSPARNRYFYLLDWEAALNKDSGLFPPQAYKHLDAFRRVYSEVFSNNIVQSKDFLQKYDHFLVLDAQNYTAKCPQDIQCPQWLEMRILSNPIYRVKPLIERDQETVLLVEKVS